MGNLRWQPNCRPFATYLAPMAATYGIRANAAASGVKQIRHSCPDVGGNHYWAV